MSFYVELELDGVLCARRCPAFYDEKGFDDHAKIRAYFSDLGYNVGLIIGIR